MSDDIALFENAVRRNALNFADWAGGEDAGLEDRDVVGRTVHPDSGDMVLYDARGRTGFIGICHDNWSDIHPVKIKNAKDKGYNLRLKKIPRRVPTIELIQRYLWITNVFLGWRHAEGGSPYSIWETPEQIEAAFRAEAKDFAEDPHLALYWVMQFGLCDDPRYSEAAARVRAHGLHESFDKLRLALAFFDGTGPDHDIDLTPSYNPDGKDYSKLFLLRRANLFYMTYSLSYRGGGVVEPLWRSVSLYRGADSLAIIRMRWLRNNLEKFDLWDALEERLNDPSSDDIPFVTYPRIFQPSRTKTAALADDLVAELLETRPMWSNRYGAFGKALLHDIRDHISDREAFRAAAVIVFDGDMGNPLFAEILASIGEEGFGDDAAREKLAAFEGLFQGMRTPSTDGLGRIGEIFGEADALLSGLDRAGMAFFVGACTHFDARKVLLRHVLLRDMEDREDHIVSLFPRTALADHELKDFFGATHPPLVKAPDDEVARALLRVLDLPERAFSSDHKHKRALNSVCDLMRVVAHEPAVFDRLIEAIQGETGGVVAECLLEGMFQARSKAAVQPLEKLSEAQATRLISAAVTFAEREPQEFRTGLRLIGDCAEQHPAIMGDPAAPHVEALLAFARKPNEAFDRPMDREDALRLLFDVFRPSAEVPAIFDMLVKRIETDRPEGVADAIFSTVFAGHHDEPERHPVPRLDAAQVERLLDATLAYLLRLPKDPKGPLRAIAACGVPAAEGWLKKTRADAALFEKLDAHLDNFISLSQELEDALDDALEALAERAERD